MFAPITYDFLAPAKIVFGWGTRRVVGELAGQLQLGQRAFLVTGSRTLERAGVYSQLCDDLGSAGIETLPLADITHEPEVVDVDEATAVLRQHAPGPGDFLVAIGGGSAIDLAKALAARATNTGGDSIRDYLEGVGRGLSLTAAPLPLLAMPSTAGTGTEATKNAVISSYDPPFKKSLRSDLMVPRAVLVDPELTVSLPATTTAYTGMDAITQLIESFVSNRRRPIPQALCRQGLTLAIPAIARAVQEPEERSAREAMAHAALLSGLALANSGLGLAHGVAAALGVQCRVPHGLACALMLPTAMDVNRNAARTEFLELAPLLTGGRHRWNDAGEAAQACADRIRDLCAEVGIPARLRDVGVRPEQLPDIVACSRGNSMSGNPQTVTDQELLVLLEALL